MKVICIKEALNEQGNKVMQFTKGKLYDCEKSIDPDGYEIKDDFGQTEIFFNLNLMFRIKEE